MKELMRISLDCSWLIMSGPICGREILKKSAIDHSLRVEAKKNHEIDCPTGI